MRFHYNPSIVLSRGLEAFSAEAASQQQWFLPDTILSKVNKYKTALDHSRFQHLYGHSPEIIAAFWNALDLDQDNLVLDELLAVMYFYATYPAPGRFPFPDGFLPSECNPKDARTLIAVVSHLIADIKGKKIFGCKIVVS